MEHTKPHAILLKCFMIFLQVSMRRVSGARIIAVLLFCISFGYGGHIMALDTRSDPPQRPCWIANQRGHHMEIYSWSRATIDSIIPFFIILIANLFLINSVRNRNKALLVDKDNTSLSSAISTSNVSTVACNDTDDPNAENIKQVTDKQVTDSENAIKLSNISAEMEDKTKPKLVKLEDPTNRLAKPEAPEKITKHAGQTVTIQARHFQTSKQIITMLIFASFAFLFLSLPWVVILAVSIQYDYMKSPHTYAYFTFGRTCATTLVGMTACVNFFIFLATGSKFRRNVRELFYCIFCIKSE